MANLLMRSVFAKKALMNPALFKFTTIRALASTVPDPVNKVNPHGWKHWKDIPDSFLPPPADPTNGIYQQKDYKIIQKKRIWYQIDDGTPIYFKEGLRDYIKVGVYLVSLVSLLVWEYYLIFKYVAV